MRHLLTALLLTLHITASAQTSLNCDSVIAFIFEQWDSVQNMSYHSEKVERKIGVNESAGFDFVVQRSPYKVAGQMSEKGHRLLYDPEISKTEALYISSGFPFTNVMLDVNGKIFRGLNHYTISDAGCEFMFNILKSQYELSPEEFGCFEGERKGEPVLRLELNTNDFTYKKSVSKEELTVLQFAKRKGVSAYLLLERNGSLESYTQSVKNLELMVPNVYGKRVTMLVHRDHGMPLLIEVEDEKGLLERYEYSDYQFNLDLPDDYFTEEHLDGLD